MTLRWNGGPVVLSLRPFPQLLVTGCLDFSFKLVASFGKRKQVQRESRCRENPGDPKCRVSITVTYQILSLLHLDTFIVKLKS